MAVTLDRQVHDIGRQVALRSQNIEKLKMIQARLDEFCMAIARAHQMTSPWVQQLSTRTNIPIRNNERSFKMLFFIMRVVADLQEIQDLAKLRSKTAQLQEQAAKLETETQGYCADIEKLKKLLRI